ncbi:MAG TPA: phage holin family protein [Gammaproteobacteria bacterium]
MGGFLVRMLVTALGLAAAAWIVPGVHVSGPGTLILAALLMGIVNAVVRPIVVLLTLPLTILTLGLFLLVVNAGLFGLVAALLDGFVVDGFWSALLGWLIVSLVGWLASAFIGPRGRYQVLVVERRIRG